MPGASIQAIKVAAEVSRRRRTPQPDALRLRVSAMKVSRKCRQNADGNETSESYTLVTSTTYNFNALKCPHFPPGSFLELGFLSASALGLAPAGPGSQKSMQLPTNTLESAPVLDHVDTRIPAQVEKAVCEVYARLFPDGDQSFVPRAFEWARQCFSGRARGKMRTL